MAVARGAAQGVGGLHKVAPAVVFLLPFVAEGVAQRGDQVQRVVFQCGGMAHGVDDLDQVAACIAAHGGAAAQGVYAACGGAGGIGGGLLDDLFGRAFRDDGGDDVEARIPVVGGGAAQAVGVARYTLMGQVGEAVVVLAGHRRVGAPGAQHAALGSFDVVLGEVAMPAGFAVAHQHAGAPGVLAVGLAAVVRGDELALGVVGVLGQGLRGVLRGMQDHGSQAGAGKGVQRQCAWRAPVQVQAAACGVAQAGEQGAGKGCVWLALCGGGRTLACGVACTPGLRCGGFVRAQGVFPMQLHGVAVAVLERDQRQAPLLGCFAAEEAGQAFLVGDGPEVGFGVAERELFIDVEMLGSHGQGGQCDVQACVVCQHAPRVADQIL